MLAKICSAAVNGIEAYPIEVEVNAGYGDTLIVIVGLPESPVKNVVLKNVKLSAEEGLTIGNAEVTASGLEVTAARGEAIVKLAGARLTQR